MNIISRLKVAARPSAIAKIFRWKIQHQCHYSDSNCVDISHLCNKCQEDEDYSARFA